MILGLQKLRPLARFRRHTHHVSGIMLVRPQALSPVALGFEPREGMQDTVSFTMAPELALRYCALPVWDRLTEMENSGELPDAWARYEAAWPRVAKAKGHLTDDGVYLASVRFGISGVYRVIVAKKPAA